MGQFAISMPQLGESIAEATLLRLKVKPGETVEADQEVAEVETSKAVMSVTTSYGGVWKEWKAKEGQSYPVELFWVTWRWRAGKSRKELKRAQMEAGRFNRRKRG